MLSVDQKQDVKTSEETSEQTACKYVIVHDNHGTNESIS